MVSPSQVYSKPKCETREGCLYPAGVFTSNGGTPRWGSRRALLGCSLRIHYPIGVVYTAALTDGYYPMMDKRYIFDGLQHNLQVPDAV